MGKKKHHEEHENLERWLVSYADFITLLFAFFTVLYATSQQDSVKYKNAADEIRKSFLSAGGVFSLKGYPFSPFEMTPDKGAPAPPGPTDQGPFVKSEDGEFADGVQEQLRGIFQQATGLNLEKGAVEMIQTENGFRVRLGEYVLFNPGSSRIKAENLRFLYAVAKRLKKYDANLIIEGHSDSTASVSKSANWQLSIDRAMNVVQFMVQGVAYPPDRLAISGFGDTRPVASNDTPQGRSRNRRVELVVNIPDSKPEAFSWVE